MIKQLSSLCIFICFTTWSQAQTASMPMADHVPADAVAYIGWAGADSQSEAYRASDLSAFVDHSNLSQIVSEYLPQLWDQLAENSNDKQAVNGLQKSLSLLWHHPSAIYASQVTINPDGTRDGNVVLICNAGTDVAALQADLQSVVRNDPHLHIVVQDSFVTLSVDDSAKAPGGPMLAAQPEFVATMKSLQPSPTIAVYVDVKSVLQKANESAQANDNVADIWPKVRDALGIATVKAFAMTAGFDGNNWMMASTVDAPNPRNGLLAAIEPKPIDPALLARVPTSAGSVSVYNFDAAKLFDTIGQAMASSPASDKIFHQAAGLATIGLGRNFRQQILAPLGPQWVMYSDAKLHSVVLLNHPSDADTAIDSIVSAIFGLSNLANTQIPGATTQPMVNVDQKTIKGIDLTSAVTKFAAPTFAAKDGVFYFGLSADSVVNSASVSSNAAALDIMHSDAFLAAKKRLGVSNFASFDYCDLPNTAPLAYDYSSAAGQQLRQIMQMFNVELPKVELPPLDQLRTHLSPALSVSWADGNGVYSKSISPFPLSTYLLGDPQQSLVGTTALSAAAAVLAPAFQHARSQANMVQTASNERAILMGTMMYASAHRGDLPPDLGTLITDGQVGGGNLKVFLKSDSKIKIPADLLTGTKERQADWMNNNTEYSFLLAGEKIAQVRNPSSTASIIPKDADQAAGRVAVGFADGHVEMVKAERAQQWLHSGGI